MEICLHKNKVGGYAYNNANTLLTQIEQFLKRQLYEESTNGMKGLASDVSNTINKYKSTIHIKKRDVLTALRAAAKRARTDKSTVETDIANNSNVQDKANQQKILRIAAIGVKEGIAEGITKIVGRNITNPILWKTDNSNFYVCGSVSNPPTLHRHHRGGRVGGSETDPLT